MQKEELRKLIFTASGKDQADTVIKNAKIVDVYSGEIIEGEDIAIVDGKIAGIGHYERSSRRTGKLCDARIY